MEALARRKVSADDYVDILDFYARQMHVLDALNLEAYADTFTEDGAVDHAHRGERVEGRAAMMRSMEAALPRYRDVAVRHWFDHLLIEPAENGWHVVYYSLVTRTDAEGKVDFEPTFTVEDDLVRLGNGEIRTRLRVVHRDEPAGAGE
ncbi:nuclear transport factor 2 family protein [Actinocorallia populi]|uniref:nuclear transport factor 2 family protein n=1 Tax=Actinocorallia populi TaxID=2079200 RepID=UPI000D090E76|nr:nuclear transport factor 2 family protein [Actinocorallia populi]